MWVGTHIFKNPHGDLKEGFRDSARSGSRTDLYYTVSMACESTTSYICPFCKPGLNSPRGHFWNNGFNYLNDTGHHPLGSPTVFNFYLPDYHPVGLIGDADLVAPEFKLHNTSSSVKYINHVHSWTQWNAVMYSWMGDYGEPHVELNTEWLESMATNPEMMINEGQILTHGQLSDQTRIIWGSMDELYWT